MYCTHLTMGGDGIARGGLSSHFYIVFYGGRSVLGHFQADYHLGGSRRGGLGGSDCSSLWISFSENSLKRDTFWRSACNHYTVICCIHACYSRQSPAPDKPFIHLFSLNYLQNFSGLSLFYPYIIPKLGFFYTFCLWFIFSLTPLRKKFTD